MAKDDRPLGSRFTASAQIGDRIFVPLDEVEALLPSPDRMAWVSDDTVELLSSAHAQGVNGIVILWAPGGEEMQTIATLEDPGEIADALEHCRRKFRNAAWVARRRMSELKVRQ
jgi:hypothetical protein